MIGREDGVAMWANASPVYMNFDRRRRRNIGTFPCPVFQGIGTLPALISGAHVFLRDEEGPRYTPLSPLHITQRKRTAELPSSMVGLGTQHGRVAGGPGSAAAQGPTTTTRRLRKDRFVPLLSRLTSAFKNPDYTHPPPL